MLIRNYASSEAGKRKNPSDAAAYLNGTASRISRLIRTSSCQSPGLIYLPGNSPTIQAPQAHARMCDHNLGD